MMQELKSQKPDSALAQYVPNAAILTNELDIWMLERVQQFGGTILHFSGPDHHQRVSNVRGELLSVWDGKEGDTAVSAALAVLSQSEHIHSALGANDLRSALPRTQDGIVLVDENSQCSMSPLTVAAHRKVHCRVLYVYEPRDATSELKEGPETAVRLEVSATKMLTEMCAALADGPKTPSKSSSP
eukprot:391450-Rhodomonas_salina.1